MKGNRFWLALSLGLMLLSGIVAALVQTSAGKVAVKDMRWETRSGELLSALLYKPASATIEHPAPAVVVCHGWWNNREIQGPICLELARRGFVVVSIDMYGHGNSDPLRLASMTVAGTGMYDAVRLVADLPYVDEHRIGVAGHSHGARACNYSVAVDDKEHRRLIAAVLLVDGEPFYFNAEGKYANVYGSRHVGLVADRYDEFCFRAYGSCGQVLTKPRDYIGTANAQSFLYFGGEPSAMKGRRVADKIYGENGVVRVIYTPSETHPWGLISKTTVGLQLAFFEKALGAPNPIPAYSQIWPIKHAFTTVGLIGFGMFLVAFARVLIDNKKIPHPRPPAAEYGGEGRQIPYGQEFTLRGRGAAWFWFALLLCAIVSGFSYVLMSNTHWIRAVTFNSIHTIFAQGAVFFIAFWLAVNGLASLVIVTACYGMFGRNGVGGVLPRWRQFFGAIWLGSIVVAAAFGIVFLLNYFFKTDLRCWLVAVKAFTPDKLCLGLRCLPMMVVYFFANSIVINCFNPRQAGSWRNLAVLMFMNTLGPLAIVVAQYATFFTTGETIRGFDPIFGVWLIPAIVYLGASVVISRILYRASGNPYLGGFINAAVVTMIAVTNTLTVVR
jgi:pimeloyl-ACP methyl ester carboxylesterase